MDSVQLWKLILDGLLVLSLLYFCLRFSKNTGSQLSTRAMGLEASLRALIKDAELAGRSLNSELVKRQSDLEKLLFDIKSVESRLESSIRGADNLKENYTREIQQAEYLLRQLQQTNSSYVPLNESNVIASQNIAPNAPEAPGTIVQSQSPLDRQVTVEKFEQAHSTTKSAPAAPSPSLEKPALNVYGEPIAASASSPAANQIQMQSYASDTTQNIQAAVVPEATPAIQPEAKPMVTESDNQALQRVYDQAENLLMAGEDLNRVAAQTNLSIDEVRMLSQMLSTEVPTGTAPAVEASSGAGASSSDERLGVLGTIKRQVQRL